MIIFTLCVFAAASLHCKANSKDSVEEPAKSEQNAAIQKVDTKAQYPTIDTSAPLKIEQYRELLPKYLSTTFCKTVYTCPEKQMPLALHEVAQFTDKSQCLARYSGWGNNDIDAKYEATKVGHLKFDAANARACLQAIEALGSQCVRLHEQPTFGLVACDNVHIPQQQEGDACKHHDECTPDLYCAQDLPGAPGICESNEGGNRFSLEGESCEYNTCANGLVCTREPDEELMRCFKFKPLQAGESCGLSLTSCAIGLTCSSVSHQCEPLAPLADKGQPCDVDKVGCKLGLTCRDYVEDPQQGGTLIGTCGSLKAEKQPCTFTSECQPNLLCDDAKCIPHPG